MASTRGAKYSAGKLKRRWRGQFWRVFDVFNESPHMMERMFYEMAAHRRFTAAASLTPNELRRYGDYAKKRTHGTPLDDQLVWDEVVDLLKPAGLCCDPGPGDGPDRNVVTRVVLPGAPQVVAFLDAVPYGEQIRNPTLRYEAPGVKPFHIAATVLEVLPAGADAHYAQAVLEILPDPPRACAVHPNATLKGRAAQWVREQRELVDVVLGDTFDSHINHEASVCQ